MMLGIYQGTSFNTWLVPRFQIIKQPQHYFGIYQNHDTHNHCGSSLTQLHRKWHATYKMMTINKYNININDSPKYVHKGLLQTVEWKCLWPWYLLEVLVHYYGHLQNNSQVWKSQMNLKEQSNSISQTSAVWHCAVVHDSRRPNLGEVGSIECHVLNCYVDHQWNTWTGSDCRYWTMVRGNSSVHDVSVL